MLSQYMVQYYRNIISLKGTKVRFTRDLQEIILKDAPELEEGSREPDKSDRFGESAITSPSFHCALQPATGSSNTPSAELWTCKSRVVRMQPNEYIKEAR